MTLCNCFIFNVRDKQSLSLWVIESRVFLGRIFLIKLFICLLLPFSAAEKIQTLTKIGMFSDIQIKFLHPLLKYISLCQVKPAK